MGTTMALNTADATELTREQVANILTKPLEQASVFLAAGPRVFDTTGPLRVPGLPGAGDPADLEWVGESELIPEWDTDFSEVQLLPSTMKSVKVLTRYSNELARQSIVSLEQTLRDRLVADVAGKLDAQFLSDHGDGVTTPRGLFAYEGATDTAVDGPITPDVILAAQGGAMGRLRNPGSSALLTVPEGYVSLRGIKDNDGRCLGAPDVSATGLTVPALRARAVLSARIPGGRAALVDMPRVAVARDLAPSVKVLAERYADYVQQSIRVVVRYDAKPLVPAGVLTLSGIAPDAAPET